jgi:hypothetical protein
VQFITKKNKGFDMKVSFANKHITHIHSTKFLSLTTDTSMSWKDHIKELTSKLHKAPYAINVLIMIYFCYVHSLTSYGIIFYGNSYHSQRIFIIQKRIIMVIMNTNKGDSCRELFKQLNILPLPSQYILSIIIFISKNIDLLIINSEIQYQYQLSVQDLTLIHLPSTILILFQKGVFYSGSTIFNHLPPNNKDLFNNEKQFRRNTS